MADVRALVAAERKTRRITHPYASYTKSNLLSCNLCHLVIKSESLWDGHLRSANHKKNVKAATTGADEKPLPPPTIKPSLKRKIEDVDDNDSRESVQGQDVERGTVTKKTKSRQVSFAADVQEIPEPKDVRAIEKDDDLEGTASEQLSDEWTVVAGLDTNTGPSPSSQTIDEDEWAAFEREVGPLAQADYSNATISAAPVSAAELKAQEDTNEDRGRRSATDAEDEREDEQQRIQDEFDILEEMEERVKRLRDRRDALRKANNMEEEPDTVARAEEGEVDAGTLTKNTIVPGEDGQEEDSDDNNDDDDDDVDDWYS